MHAVSCDIVQKKCDNDIYTIFWKWYDIRYHDISSNDMFITALNQLPHFQELISISIFSKGFLVFFTEHGLDFLILAQIFPTNCNQSRAKIVEKLSIFFRTKKYVFIFRHCICPKCKMCIFSNCQKQCLRKLNKNFSMGRSGEENENSLKSWPIVFDWSVKRSKIPTEKVKVQVKPSHVFCDTPFTFRKGFCRLQHWTTQPVKKTTL